MNVLFEVLERALTTKRPAESLSEGQFVMWLVNHLGNKVTAIDSAGNFHVDLRSDICRTLFTAHTDTCARSDEGPNKVVRTPTHYHADGDVLGADDGAGIAILCNLIAHDVPGYYIFTRQEEIGAPASTWLAECMPDLLRQFERAIAFDRKGTSEVIMSMCVGDTASTVFAEAVCTALNDRGMLYAPSDAGTFTDVANWTRLIPECINIAVGYENEHRPTESLLIQHFAELGAAVLTIDWDSLPTVRDPTIRPAKKSPFYSASTLGRQSDFEWALTQRELEESEGYSKEEYVLFDAIAQAVEGQPGGLMLLAAQHIHPEDPNVALLSMNSRRLDEDFLEDLYNYDYHNALELTFETASR